MSTTVPRLDAERLVDLIDRVNNMGKHPNWPCSFAYIATDLCFIDHEFQRPPDREWVKRTANEFDPELFGVVIASLRSNGMFSLMDGQQRWLVLRDLGITDLPAYIHTGKTREEESRIFVAMNFDRKMVNAWYHYRALRFAGDERILDVENIVQSAGFVVGSKAGKSDAIIQSPSALMSIYDGRDARSTLPGPEVLTRTLQIIDGAWGADMAPGWKQAKSSAMIRGVARWVSLYPKADPKIVAETLGKVTPKHVFDRAQKLAEGSGSGGKGRQIPKVITAMVGRRIKK